MTVRFAADLAHCPEGPENEYDSELFEELSGPPLDVPLVFKSVVRGTADVMIYRKDATFSAPS